MSALTSVEIENLRFHLGYGNLQVGAYPWTPDGFFELFTNVIKPYLSDAEATTATTAISPGVVTVTPVDMTGIAVNVRLVVDNGDDAEVVVVKAASLTTFTARFAKAHDAAGYPIAVETGTSRLRQLLHEADRVYQAMLAPSITAVSGLKSVDKGEVEWFGPTAVIKAVFAQYQAVIEQISRLVRVLPAGDGGGGGATTRMEAY